ncbi:conjugal transfer protein TraF [Helicobacter salomonis]|uniref:conjugal transfer protein TraF n=1 Tax=Helicobacter salomonis TaxID=56878 RepID=UPI000CF1073F|nr:conjugal transfer protein TraF [Helicobacter salomonis]
MFGKSMQAVGLCALICNSLGALEFGGMGNTSFAMGGAGVALEDSTWGLYYNPALLDIDDRTKFGYSFGVGLSSKNILPLASKALQISQDTSVQNLDSLGLKDLIDAQRGQLPHVSPGGSLTISGNSSPAARNAIELVNSVSNLLKLNGLSLRSQNGLVLQIHPKIKSVKGGIGTFGVALFASAFAGASAVLNPRYNQAIVDTGQFGMPYGYVKIDASSNSLTFTRSSQAAFNNTSMLSPQATTAAGVRALVLGSLPVGYAKGFDFKKFGKLSAGVTFKYIYSVSYGFSMRGPLNGFINSISHKDILSFDNNSLVRQSHFGLDLGLAYRVYGFSVGFVGKYLNAPKIRYNDGYSLRIDPQVRMGLGYRWKWLSLAWDVDLTSNKTLMLEKYSRMMGGGIMTHLKWLAVKFGAMGNIAPNGLHQGIILTGGMRFFKVLDISVQSGLQTTAFNGIKIPNYLAIKLGGGWEW